MQDQSVLLLLLGKIQVLAQNASLMPKNQNPRTNHIKAQPTALISTPLSPPDSSP